MSVPYSLISNKIKIIIPLFQLENTKHFYCKTLRQKSKKSKIDQLKKKQKNNKKQQVNHDKPNGSASIRFNKSRMKLG
uniref:Uncharacterized protein n=1 Tax=Strigamia maritima TaxID=126957 RepID=T1JAC8_STRMM